MTRISFEPQWHVVYTMPKSERLVASQISDMGFESYLPLHKVVRQWSDRKKKIEVPLFPNYVFVKVHEQHRISLFSIYRLVSFVSFERKPVVLPENQISTIRNILSTDVDVVEDDYFQEGQKIKISSGQFAGLEGVVVRKNGNARLLIQMDGLLKAFSINIPARIAKTTGTESALI